MDDCAVYDIDEPMSLVVGSDYVRGPKFALYEAGLLNEYDLGYYLVIANVSDIAAMGAAPIGVLTVVRYPATLSDEGYCALMAGIHQACTDCGTVNVGGDIGNAERIILAGTALGICRKGSVLRRMGAQIGDALCITGPCGILGAAVAYFPKREVNAWALSVEAEEVLLQAWKRPRARVAEGLILSQLPIATACQDTSDGLEATIEQLAAASGVGFEVQANGVPLAPAVLAVAELLGVDPLTLAMSASSDFQLAFTVPSEKLDECARRFASSGLDLFVIGRATEPTSGITLVGDDGTRSELPGVAWKHQSSDISTLVLDAQAEAGSTGLKL
jgi:thiamine-monophosphate kinase